MSEGWWGASLQIEKSGLLLGTNEASKLKRVGLDTNYSDIRVVPPFSIESVERFIASQAQTDSTPSESFSGQVDKICEFLEGIIPKGVKGHQAEEAAAFLKRTSDSLRAADSALSVERLTNLRMLTRLMMDHFSLCEVPVVNQEVEELLDKLKSRGVPVDAYDTRWMMVAMFICQCLLSDTAQGREVFEIAKRQVINAAKEADRTPREVLRGIEESESSLGMRCQLSFQMHESPGRRLKSGDFGDMMHRCYLPYVELMTSDGASRALLHDAQKRTASQWLKNMVSRMRPSGPTGLADLTEELASEWEDGKKNGDPNGI